MATAGRTVAFSGLTVAIALGSLLFFPQVFLRSMGFGGMAAVLVAMLAALTVLPALLAVLGPKVDSLRIPILGRRRPVDPTAEQHGAWYRLARSVMRRPVAYVAVIVPLLLIAGLPFLRVEFGGVDHRALPEGTESRVVSEALLTEFPGGGTTTHRPGGHLRGRHGVRRGPGQPRRVRRPADRAARRPVRRGDRGRGRLRAGRRYGTGSRASPTEARDLVGEVRAVPAPEGAEVLVGGRAADLRDLLSSLGSTLPWMGLFVVGVTLVLLFLAFGSVVLPVKAVVMNVLSLAASFGALVWIFQDGHLSSLLGFTSTGAVEATQPILMLAIAFGLSMDYEVFLLSRMREQWDRTGDNTEAVATGLQRTGRIITSAALLLVVVIGAFATSGIVFIKMIGIGLVIAIIIDATLVRALLVPATMRLMGKWNWWAPAPLARFWSRHGFRESDDAVTLPDARRPADQPVRV